MPIKTFKSFQDMCSKGARLVARPMVLAGGFSCLIAGQASAGPIGLTDLSGISLFATGGEVTAYFAGSNAGFNSTLSLISPSYSGEIFPNHATAIGTAFSLGTFAAGTPLTFRLNVINTGDNWYTGAAGSNADGIVHASVTSWVSDASIPANGLLIGFEDLFGGGDFDYDDHQFVFSSVSTVSVPEPESLILFGMGMLGLIGMSRRQKQATSQP